MKKIIGIVMICFPVFLYAQEFNVQSIPDSLTANAHMVVRLEEQVTEIYSPAKAVEHERHVYTILDEEGDRYGSYSSRYNKFISIDHISGSLYNAAGKEIRHSKKKDMQDRSFDGDGALMTDTRYIVNDFYNRNYPYTVEYEQEVDLNGLFNIDEWEPCEAPNISVQVSRYIIIAPSDYVVRYKAFNYPFPPTITEAKGKKTYTWELHNMKAKTRERFSPQWRDLNPVVLVAPSDFEMDGFKGNMENWQNFGKFIYQLYQGRDALPAEIKKKVHELTDGLTDVRQKINVLYDYLQKNTRYISIQLGIGGWQPFDANFVATKKYGDCKALSNFMVALLKEAGINGKDVLIRSDENAPRMVTDFPSNQFNHAIACVPLGKDTVWLECTSPYTAPGYMGTFTGNRNALLIDETGGYVVKTPDYTYKENLKIRNVDCSVDNNGSLDANIHSLYKATSSELASELMHTVSQEERTKFLNGYLGLPTYSVESSKYVENKKAIPEITEDLHILSPGYANISGKRLFISPNLLDKSNLRFSKDSVRLYDINIQEGFTAIDTIHIAVPPGYSAESIPDEIKLESKFGKYRSKTVLVNNHIIYYRYREQYNGRFPAKDYQEMQEYYEAVFKADRNRVVLVKKE